MNKEFNHNFYGMVLLFGGLIYLLTNVFYEYLPLGDWLYFFGLFIAMPAFLLVCRTHFKSKSFFFYLVADLYLNLSLTKLFTQCFLNPFHYQPSEFFGLAICIIIIIYRLIKKK